MNNNSDRLQNNDPKDFWAPPTEKPATVVTPAVETNSFALFSLILGIVGLFVPVLASVPAIFLGHSALRRMRSTGEPGRNFALIGLWLGYLVTGACVVIALLFIAGFVSVFMLASESSNG